MCVCVCVCVKISSMEVSFLTDSAVWPLTAGGSEGSQVEGKVLDVP